MSIAATIREKLMIALRPTRLDVINESHVHAGHRSSPGTGVSHFRVLVMSPEFAGKSRVDRHRLINDTLAAELKGRVHYSPAMRTRREKRTRPSSTKSFNRRAAARVGSILNHL